MSYDLLVFDPVIAPRDRAAFMAWYGDLTKWTEIRDYNSPEGLTGKLPVFLESLLQRFPAMNGPLARKRDNPDPGSFDEAMVTDYTLASSAIYMTFSRSVSEQAHDRVFSTALVTGVGFFDVSARNGVILHDRDQFEDLMGP